MGIYLGETKITGTGVQIDSALSSTSQHAVTNAAITNALTEVGYSEWQKPSDWIDIRSGALPNSVYFLVAHSSDYTTYPSFVVKATVSNSGTYDIYVDGVKQATTASGTETTLSWQTLALESGWEVTYPVALKTHVVRVTPTLNTNNLTSISTGSISDKGILWAHFTTTNYISLANFAQSSTSPNANTQAPVWESVTAENNELNVKDISYAFDGIRSLKNIPTLIAESNQTAMGAYLFIARTQIKKVKLVNFRNNGNSVFRYCPNLEEINLENCIIGTGNAEYILQEANSLRKMPSIDFSNTTSLSISITKMPKLEPTFMDFSSSKNLNKLDCYGTSALPSYGIKGITVSNEAPFGGSSPQIQVIYTGMNRSALVNLFKSMPYNVGYTVVGSPTIADGVVSGFSSSNYLQLPNLPESITSFHLHTVATINSQPSSPAGIFMVNGYPSLEFQGAGVFRAYTTTSGGTAEAHGYIGTAISYGTKVEVDCYFENGTTRFVATQGGVTKLDVSYSDTKIASSYITFGRYWNPLSDGSIDLNGTYININGVPWFTGKAAMTKTCSIVGCTGTADLTQADKDIALDKGWSLTVA